MGKIFVITSEQPEIIERTNRMLGLISGLVLAAILCVLGSPVPRPSGHSTVRSKQPGHLTVRSERPRHMESLPGPYSPSADSPSNETHAQYPKLVARNTSVTATQLSPASAALSAGNRPPPRCHENSHMV